jgi:hypothetical protein
VLLQTVSNKLRIESIHPARKRKNFLIFKCKAAQLAICGLALDRLFTETRDLDRTYARINLKNWLILHLCSFARYPTATCAAPPPALDANPRSICAVDTGCFLRSYFVFLSQEESDRGHITHPHALRRVSSLLWINQSIKACLILANSLQGGTTWLQ